MILVSVVLNQQLSTPSTMQNNEENSLNRKTLRLVSRQVLLKCLVTKTLRAIKQYPVKQVLLAGGVAANKGLRTALSAAFEEIQDVELVIPPLKLCTDNAAMIAAVGTCLV